MTIHIWENTPEGYVEKERRNMDMVPQRGDYLGHPLNHHNIDEPLVQVESRWFDGDIIHLVVRKY